MADFSPKRVSLSVRDFAIPCPRVGSIETHSGFGRTPEDGETLHLRVQLARKKLHPRYESEAATSHTFVRQGYAFEVGGRMDGYFGADAPDIPRIEEIKTAFNIGELLRKLDQNRETHPYCLQLRTYGYLHRQATGIVPRLSFHLVSTRNAESLDLEISLDTATYEAWLERRLEECVEETKRAEARARRRVRAADHFPFPFPRPRPGQVDLIRTVEEGMRACTRMLIQAPTGLGKTVGVLYPALREALARGQNVVYVTPKNSQHSVAEDAIARFREAGSEVRSLTLTAKSKICFKPEPLCNPEFCEYARDYYEKVHAAKLPELLGQQTHLGARLFRELGEQYEVCPFELQLETAKDADTVVCDYNYVFSPHGAVGRVTGEPIDGSGKPNLVVDEAHNLFARGMDYYSPALSSYQLEKMRESVRQLPARFVPEAERLLDDAIETLRSLQPQGTTKTVLIDPPVEPFLEHDAKLRAFLTRYLESDVEIQPRDVVMRMCFYWSEFTSHLELAIDPLRHEFFTTYQPSGTGGTVRITCCDASEMLKACYDAFEQVVGFSATLKPFEYYAKLSGLELTEIRTAEFESPFPKRHRKLLIIPQISTKYSERERNYPKIADAIARIAGLRRGNYLAFFPSFEFLERVMERFLPPEGFLLLRQEREMTHSAIETVLHHLREAREPTLLFAVQGGVFSEGIDYAGDAVIGAFVVGPPLPLFDLEREEMRAYYQARYGSGFEYAYTYPAMAKAVQAAGRVIRSEADRGLIVLMDNRFLDKSYCGSMPGDWFEASPRELVSQSILKDVQRFWEQGEENPDRGRPAR